MSNYYVINLEKVNIEKGHPYTLVFEGYIPTFGNNKLYTFKYDGDIAFTDASLPDDIKEDFENQLLKDYGCVIMFDLKEVRKNWKLKNNIEWKYKIQILRLGTLFLLLNKEYMKFDLIKHFHFGDKWLMGKKKNIKKEKNIYSMRLLLFHLFFL